MALRRRPCALSAALKQQHHITPNATEEIKLDEYRLEVVKADRFMAAPPSDINVLLMEGTNLGSDKSCVTESDLEADFETPRA